MKHKTAELEGEQLGRAVAMAIGHPHAVLGDGQCVIVLPGEDPMVAGVPFDPWRDWALGGPLIEGHMVSLRWNGPRKDGMDWTASTVNAYRTEMVFHSGSMPLIAAMRVIVASKLGEEVEIP